jgi:hypothetical protein
VPDLSAKQRAAVKAAMTTMLRDIGFNKMMSQGPRPADGSGPAALESRPISPSD